MSITQVCSGFRTVEINRNQIVKSFRQNDFEKLTDVIDIVIVEKHLGKLSGIDKNTLSSWEKWFEKKDCPFIIVEYSDCFKIWKEKTGKNG